MGDQSDSAKQGGADYEIDPATLQATDTIQGREKKARDPGKDKGYVDPRAGGPGLAERIAAQKRAKENQMKALAKPEPSPSPK